MPVISQARIQAFTGKITFEQEPPDTGGQTVSASITASAALLSITGPTGATGPAGAAGTANTVNTSAITLSLPGVFDAAASAVLIAAAHKLLGMQVMATTTGPTQNYILALYDGNPAMSGVLVYQATGISATSYIDSAPFFLNLTSGQLWGQVTNIDADVTVVTVTLQYLTLS